MYFKKKMDFGSCLKQQCDEGLSISMESWLFEINKISSTVKVCVRNLWIFCLGPAYFHFVLVDGVLLKKIYLMCTLCVIVFYTLIL